MKILITGAHFTPAFATIEELNKYKDVEIVYVGRKTTLEGDNTSSVESRLLPKLGVKFITITAGRLQRTFTPFTLISLLKIPIGFIQALHIILREKPDVVLSFGGYIALPLVIVAWLFSIPIIIHEQTLISGLANRLGSFFADKIAISFPENKLFDKAKAVLTGNPLRREILNVKNASRVTGMPKVLIAGGNQGSHVINMAVEDNLDELTKIAKVTHQTGDSKYRDFERLKPKENGNYKVEKFIDEGWGKILGECDLIVSRAGINTLMELAFLGKPALVIPIDNLEQNKNAKFFESLGLIKILSQSKLTSESLLENIKIMLSNLTKLKSKTLLVRKVIIPDAAKKVALETMLFKKK